MPKAKSDKEARSKKTTVASLLKGLEMFDIGHNPEKGVAKAGPDGTPARGVRIRAGQRMRRDGVMTRTEGPAWMKSTTIANVKDWLGLDIYNKWVKSRERMVSDAVSHKISTTDHTRYPAISEIIPNLKKRFILRIPPELNPPQPVCLARWPGSIKREEAKRLFQLWDDLVNPSDGRAFVFHTPDADNRSATPAAHFGCWCHYTNTPHITADSLPEDPIVAERLRLFLEYVGATIVPAAGNILEQIAPAQLGVVNKLQEYCLEECGESLRSRKWLQFQYFVTMAVKEGSSEKSHLDLMDWKDWLTLVFSIGTYESDSFFVLPQLGLKVNMRPGDGIAFLSNHLMHWATYPTDGRRLVFTCFVDKITFLRVFGQQR
ncbi:unnamed protein product [Peniophora sp. CBMAI 1063]|nr:unnamed protein product [Peniophora sp. CBMAI 1063]